MSLNGTMRTGVSGMNAQANRLSTVADNIANANTTGYKRASTEFSSMILPATNGSYNSGGVETKVRYSISTQGTFSYTTSSTDLAINGDGFFIVQGSDGQNFLTRAGSFTPMDDGTLMNAAGFTMMGYEYSSTDDPTIVVNGFDGLTQVNLGSGELNATGSTAGNLDVNLPSTEAVGYKKATSLVAFDSQGNSRLLNFTYEKTADNAWTVSATYDDGSGTPVSVMAATAMTFDANGKLLTPSPAKLTTTAQTIGGANLAALELDITNSTQLASPFNVSNGKINGNAASKVTGYEISADGIVSLKYANGSLTPKYRIAMANVESPDNLTPMAGNVYSQSNDSGVIVMGFAGNSGLGSILSGALEDSNVDIATELTSMIESQRNYTANSKVFQTGSELLDVLINLKR